MNERFSLAGEYEVLLSKHESEIKKSKFIAYVYNINTEIQVNKILNNIKTTHKDAKHIVYAYKLENTGKYTDDKEPSNTAGKPIYSMLEKENLVNVLVIVVRYFGGILLGTGPLTRAYLGVAIDAINKCNKITFVKYKNIELIVEYSEEAHITKQIVQKGGKIINVKYEDKVKIIAEIPEEN